MEPIMLRIIQVAQLLNVSRSSAYAMVASGELPSLRIRGGIRVSVHALEKWLAERLERGKA